MSGISICYRLEQYISLVMLLEVQVNVMNTLRIDQMTNINIDLCDLTDQWDGKFAAGGDLNVFAYNNSIPFIITFSPHSQIVMQANV